MKHQFHVRDDGLKHCKVCNGAEGSLTTHCCGHALSEAVLDEIACGEINYDEGSGWYGWLGISAATGLADAMARADEPAAPPKEPLRQLVNEIRQCSDELYSVPGYSSLVDRLNDIAARLEEHCT